MRLGRTFRVSGFAFGLALGSGLLTLTKPEPARADVDARRLFGAASRRVTAANTARALGGTDLGLGLLVRLPAGVTAEERDLIPVTGRWAAVRGSAPSLLEVMARNPDLSFRWSAPFRPMLDHAGKWTGTTLAREETGLTGQGVVVGIVDTGVDTKHPGLRNADGTTRVLHLIDFAKSPHDPPRQMEVEYHCDRAESPCKIFDAEEINELLANEEEGDEPTDEEGHGTHVASLAAGNGAPDGTYVGSAPNADLVVAKVTALDGSISDSAILLGTRFVYERAREVRKPAVVNISLGSDFGAHDGSSGLEQGLAELVQEPGRGLVIAAGNSAGLYGNDLTSRYPGPFGVHTEVHVPRGGEAIVPMLTPVENATRTRGSVYAWIAAKPGDDLRVGVDTGQGRNLPVLGRGDEATYVGSDFGDSDDIEVSILNGIEDEEIGNAPESAVVIISGEWRAGRTFALRLEGNASARIWLASDGDLDPSISGGAVLPRARKAGTICVPGTHPDLISVGATLNRTSWVDAAGNELDERAHGALEDAPEDTTAYFSSAGPTNLGFLKPDIVAPGAFVIGAMSKEADPRTHDFSDFSSGGMCPDPDDECYVVSDYYAVSSGTSMSSPVVAGAVALLLERDPTLSQARIRDLLQAGARPLEGVTFAQQQVGAGALNVIGALQAQDASERPAAEPSEATLRLAESFAYPDPNTPLQGLVVLRDAKGEPATGFDRGKLQFSADGAAVQRFEPTTDGLYRLTVAAPRGSGGSSLKLVVSYDGNVLAEADVPVAVDPVVAEEGFHARGGCSFGAPAAGWPWAPTTAALALLTLVAARRKRGFRS